MKGFGKVVGPNTVEVTLNEGGSKKTISTKNIVIATGSDVVSLPGLKVNYTISTNILYLIRFLD